MKTGLGKTIAVVIAVCLFFAGLWGYHSPESFGGLFKKKKSMLDGVNLHYSHPYYITARIDWQDFVRVNQSQVVPLGQRVLIPLVFISIKDRELLLNRKVVSEFGSSSGDFKKNGVADFGETAIISEIVSFPLTIYVPLTVKGEGDFSAGFYVKNGGTIDVGINVFSFEGKVAFSDRTTQRNSIEEMVIDNFQGQMMTEEKLVEEVAKLEERYYDKYHKIR
jgi:hypothetical protein